MDLRHPATWLENLGAAKRMSPYRVTLENCDQRGYRVYVAECDIKTPSGHIAIESARIRSNVLLTDSITESDIAIEALRKHVRGKYPLTTSLSEALYAK